MIIIALAMNYATAQKESAVWYFGDFAGVDFNSGSPVALTDGQLFTKEGCATISDANGNLQFYTDVNDAEQNLYKNSEKLTAVTHSYGGVLPKTKQWQSIYWSFFIMPITNYYANKKR